MFTGIIENLGCVEKRAKEKLTISVAKKFARAIKKGGSVAVDGACLTVVAIDIKRGTIAFDVMPETWKCTALGSLINGSEVNLELPLKIGDRLNGHIVSGHIDSTAKLLSIKESRGSRILTFSAPNSLTRYIIQKGSVTINGVSLTVISASRAGFSVGIIPHTWENTSLKNLKKGSRVNIETDMIAKYVDSLVKKYEK